MKPYNKTNGKCPYCNSDNFSYGAERRPSQRVDRCNLCLKYSVYSTSWGLRYPLDNPEDQGSDPYK